MRSAGFDPLRLTADASLNRVVIGDVGCPEIAGMMAGQACSRDALCALAARCGLAGLQPDRLSDAIASALAFPATPAGRAAARMAGPHAPASSPPPSQTLSTLSQYDKQA